MEEGKAVDVVFRDYSKAFDTVSHPILDELSSCEMNRSMLRWVMNQLDGGSPRAVEMGLHLAGSQALVLFPWALF